MFEHSLCTQHPYLWLFFGYDPFLLSDKLKSNLIAVNLFCEQNVF